MKELYIRLEELEKRVSKLTQKVNKLEAELNKSSMVEVSNEVSNTSSSSLEGNISFFDSETTNENLSVLVEEDV